MNTSEKKVTDAVSLKVERAGGARGEYDIRVVDRSRIYRTKLILAVLMRKLTKLSQPFKSQLLEDKTRKLDDVESGTFIPFKEALKIGLPHKQVLDMTAAETFNTYLTLLAKLNSDSRPKLVYSDGMVMPIATFDDLAAAMSLLDASNNPGLSPELQSWYQDVFMAVYNRKLKEQKKREEDDKRYENQEVFVITADLIERHKELSNSINNKAGYKEENSHQILQKHLYPLIDAGYVEDEKVEGTKAKRYRPITPLKYSFYSFSDEKNTFPYKLKMKVESLKQIPTKKKLELQISESLRYSSKYSEKDKINFKIVDAENKEISVAELVEKYLGNPGDYFICPDEKGNNKADSKVKKEEKSNPIDKGQKEEYSSREENYNKSQPISQSNENNVQNASQHMEENNLSTKKEQIEYYKAVPHSSFPIPIIDRENEDLEYTYDNNDDNEEHDDDEINTTTKR